MEACFVCQRIQQIKNGTNPYFVEELETGYVVVGDFQYFRGHTVFISKEHKTELHQLESKQRFVFLKEMSLVAEAVFRAFNPQKMNYELLGNTDTHMHWHLFPRYKDDLISGGPIWLVDGKIRNSEAARPTEAELASLKVRIRNEVKRLREAAALDGGCWL